MNVPKPCVKRMSNSFADDEIILVRDLLRVTLRNGDAAMLTKRPAFQRTASKFERMAREIEKRNAALLPSSFQDVTRTLHAHGVR